MKSKLPKFNVKLLRRVVKHIMAEPLRLNMDNYAMDFPKSMSQEDPDLYPKCGTQGCIAGWAVMLTDTKTRKQRHELACETSPDEFFNRAQKLLGLTDGEAGRLFLDYWCVGGEAAVAEVKRKTDALIAARKEGREWVLEYNLASTKGEMKNERTTEVECEANAGSSSVYF